MKKSISRKSQSNRRIRPSVVALALLALAACGDDNVKGLQSDHSEALRRGCTIASSGRPRDAYFKCFEEQLAQLRGRGGPVAISQIPASTRSRVRAACEITKPRGLLAYDDCLRAQTGAAPPAVRLPPSPVPPNRPGDQAAAATELFERLSPSIHLVLAAPSPGASIVNQGSAVAVTDQLLLTNCHVIEKAQFLVIEINGRRHQSFRVAGDEASDRCVLRVEERILRPIRRVRAFNSLRVGERVYAIGNPRGLQKTFSEGLLSGLRMRRGVNIIQFNAPITNGSSGGGLFDSDGNLIGITTFKIGEDGSLYFAIAADAYDQFWRPSK